MSTFSKIKKSGTLYEDVVKEIKMAILSGRFPSGSPLPSEQHLAEQFGVSRPVVREALRYLQFSGFLEIRRGTKGGAYIKDSLRNTFMNHISDLILYRHFKGEHLAQARLLLEPEICRLAAENASPKDIATMKALSSQAAACTNPEARNKMFYQFHRLIGQSCGNPLYALLLESIMDFVEGFIRTITHTVKPDPIPPDRQGDHDEIIEALENHDPERAAELAIQHATLRLERMKDLERTYLALLAGEEFSDESFD